MAMEAAMEVAVTTAAAMAEAMEVAAMEVEAKGRVAAVRVVEE